MAFAMSPQLLDGCVLAVLSHGDAYGYILTQQVKSRLDIPEPTLYPVLRRLQRDGMLKVYDRPYQGRNRRYYRMTAAGRERLTQYCSEWRQLTAGIDRILEGEWQDEKT